MKDHRGQKMFSPHAINFLNWQNRHCTQTIIMVWEKMEWKTLYFASRMHSIISAGQVKIGFCEDGLTN